MDRVGGWLTGSVYRCQVSCDRYVLSHARVPSKGAMLKNTTWKPVSRGHS